MKNKIAILAHSEGMHMFGFGEGVIRANGLFFALFYFHLSNEHPRDWVPTVKYRKVEI